MTQPATAVELAALLTRLVERRPSARVTGSQVGNLAVVDEEGDYIGYIEVCAGGVLELFEDG
jgi:hypothetical protein